MPIQIIKPFGFDVQYSEMFKKTNPIYPCGEKICTDCVKNLKYSPTAYSCCVNCGDTDEMNPAIKTCFVSRSISSLDSLTDDFKNRNGLPIDFFVTLRGRKK